MRKLIIDPFCANASKRIIDCEEIAGKKAKEHLEEQVNSTQLYSYMRVGTTVNFSYFKCFFYFFVCFVTLF